MVYNQRYEMGIFANYQLHMYKKPKSCNFVDNVTDS